ncbi:cobaltochelatase subunit CobN [Massilia sp. B-10]|nr:cobaltochelatase subunit CobN [Massilia sp. B-10]
MGGPAICTACSTTTTPSDYLGGLSLAIEGRTGQPPDALILQHAEPGRADVEPLTTALLGELRGRFLNPAWLKPLMGHGYAGRAPWARNSSRTCGAGRSPVPIWSRTGPGTR